MLPECFRLTRIKVNNAATVNFPVMDLSSQILHAKTRCPCQGLKVVNTDEADRRPVCWALQWSQVHVLRGWQPLNALPCCAAGAAGLPQLLT